MQERVGSGFAVLRMVEEGVKGWCSSAGICLHSSVTEFSRWWGRWGVCGTLPLLKWAQPPPPHPLCLPQSAVRARKDQDPVSHLQQQGLKK